MTREDLIKFLETQAGESRFIRMSSSDNSYWKFHNPIIDGVEDNLIIKYNDVNIIKRLTLGESIDYTVPFDRFVVDYKNRLNFDYRGNYHSYMKMITDNFVEMLSGASVRNNGNFNRDLSIYYTIEINNWDFKFISNFDGVLKVIDFDKINTLNKDIALEYLRTNSITLNEFIGDIKYANFKRL